MNVELIFQIAAIGILVSVLNQLLIRSGREEQALMTTLAGLIVVLLMVIIRLVCCSIPLNLCLIYKMIIFQVSAFARSLGLDGI